MSESLIKIGVVEDNPLDVELLQRMLAEPPEILFQLHHSSSLQEALALLEVELLDVMLLDLGLPDCQDLEAFHQIKSITPNLPVIIFSGHAEKELAIQAVADGAQDYLVKGQTSAHMVKRAIFYAIERQRSGHEKLVRATFSAAANGIVTTTPDGRFILANPAYCAMVGYSEAELSSLNFYTLIHPDDRAHNLELTERLLGGEINDFSVEERYIRKDGDIVWTRVSVSLERPSDEQAPNIIAIIEDITARKQAETLLRESEYRTRAIIDSAPDAVIGMDEQGRVTDWNPCAEAIFGWSRDEALGQELAEMIVPEQHREAHRRGLARFLSTKEEYILNRRIEITALRRSGEEFPVELAITLFQANNTHHFTAFIADLTERRRAEVALRKSEAGYRTLFEYAPSGISLTDPEGNIIDANASLCQMLGYSRDALIGMHASKVVAETEIQHIEPALSALKAKSDHHREWLLRHKDGSLFPVEVDATTLSDGNVLAIVSDITERKQSELELGRLNRALRMLTSCNELLIHAADEKKLLSDICQLAVEVGGYQLAWVGYAQDDATRSIKPMGYAGPHADYLSGIKVSWSEDDPAGRGPAGKTIRSGKVVTTEDFAQDPAFSPWLALARKHGLSGAVCLPLKDKDRTFGFLALYIAEVRQITADEIKLLQEMADDLAFGIINIHTQDEQKRIQSAISRIAASVSASSGTEFFQQLVLSMTEALGAQAGFLARLLPGKSPSARTIAAVVDGKVIDNMEYAIAGTPCENLISADNYAVLDKAVECFPHAPTLTALGMQAYVGRQLLNSAGQPMGQLFVLFREPLKQADFITSTLQIFGARASAELERQEADKRFRDQASLLDKAQDAIVVRGLDHVIQFWNKGAERLYGWTAAEAIGASSVELLYDDRSSYDEICEKVLEFGEWSGEVTQHRKDGSVVIVEAHWNLVRDDDNQPYSILAINTDISQRKAAEKKIEHLAFYDNLTGLANRLLLADRLQLAFATSVRASQTGALLFIDLDNFKMLNDTLGHDMGDLLLQQVAHRLINCVRESDTVARLGGDEFVVMLEGMSHIPHEAATQAKVVGEKILASFNQPFQLAGLEHYTSPSIGITLFSDQVNTAEEVLKRADIAMYQAKASGRNTMRFFDPEMQAVISARAVLEADLHEALQHSQFLLHYQPQINHKGRIIGAEALVRWQHPVHGLVPPIKFIPAAEETGLILLLGHWVLETACAQLATWATRRETAELSISVNVSARQFRQPDFVEQVLAAVDYTRANPERLKLELTESLLADNTEDVIAKMIALKANGVGFSLDDFGIGYSSLAYLKRLPLDQLKIDQSFVRDVLTDPNDATIARTILALGKSLGMTVVAEGVETREQHDFLAKEGCNVYQGYYFSRPVPIDQFEEYMATLKRQEKKTKKK